MTNPTDDVLEASSFSELCTIAMPRFMELGEHVEMVCGPISTGGYGNAEKNFAVFGATVQKFIELGHVMFDQRPYEKTIGPLAKRWKEDPANNGYCMPILLDFYAPLFATKRVKIGWFLPGWESSHGASWEHAELSALGAEIRYLKREWVDRLAAGDTTLGEPLY